jgi:hypothetical protein
VLCLPALPHLLIIFNRRATLDWVPPRGWLALRDLAIRWFPARLWLPILASALLSGFSARQLRGLLDRRGATLLILWLALPMLAFELAPALLGASLLSERYVLFALPSALYLVTWPLALGREDSWRRWIPLVAVLVITVTGAYLTPPLSRGPTFAAHLDQGWSRAVRALDEEARREDVVLYWTGFVEANRVRLGHPDPLLISLLESPLTANLRPGHRLTLIGLPRSFEQPPPDDVSAALARAARATRVWIIALRDGAVPAASALRRDAGFEIAGTIRYGTVTLTLLQRT